MRAKDGYVVVFPIMEHMWQAWLKVMGEPSWGREPRLQSHAGRQRHADEVNALIEEWTRSRSGKELEEMGQAVHVPVGAVATPADLLDNPQEAHRRYFVEAAHPEAGALKYPSAAYQFSRTPWRLERPAPLLGQHNEEVFCRRLGYSREDVARMRESGIV